MEGNGIAQVLSRLVYGLYVVSGQAGGKRNGFTATWVTQLSFDPPLIGVGIRRDHYTFSLIKDSGTFAVSLLGERHRDLAEYFIEPSLGKREKFDEIPFTTAKTGAPVLEGAIGYLDCRLKQIIEPGGDHLLLVGEIVDGALLEEETPLTSRDLGTAYL